MAALSEFGRTAFIIPRWEEIDDPARLLQEKVKMDHGVQAIKKGNQKKQQTRVRGTPARAEYSALCAADRLGSGFGTVFCQSRMNHKAEAIAVSSWKTAE